MSDNTHRCEVSVSINGVKCNRPAKLEVTDEGVHIMWLCAAHSKPWCDDKGRSHDSVWRGCNMIPKEILDRL